MSYKEYMDNFREQALEVKGEIVEWIYNWFHENGDGCTAVVGLSGGKDSAVVAALCVEALGADRVFGVYMPNNYHYVGDVDKDWLDVVALVGHLNIKCKCISIKGAYNDIIKNVSAEPIKLPAVYRNLERLDTKIEVSEQTRINLAPRIRMSVLYAVAQSINGRVANTCNLSEDWVGYATRYGDSVGDFSPLSMLTTDEVIEIGLACGLPEELVRKTPTDGLCGKTDEDNLGFTYRTLNEYIRWGTCKDEKIKALIDEKHEKNMFKLRPMPVFDYPCD